MFGTAQDTSSKRTAGALRRAARYAIAASVTTGVVLSVAAIAPAAQAATSAHSSTARIQALLDSPVNGTVNLPSGTFTIGRPLHLNQGERIIGHHTTLRVASGTGDYKALLTGASAATDLSGLAITGVTFDQNNNGNPVRTAARLIQGTPRFVILVGSGTSINITNDKFIGTDNLNTIVTGGGTHDVTISGNVFKTSNAKVHDHSTIYTSGTNATIKNNTFTGRNLINSAAIEVHGEKASITGNHISGYYRGVNIVASDTTFHANHIIAAANPVDLWSTGPTALTNVAVTGNVLNRNLPLWHKVMASHGLHLAPAKYLRQVIRNSTSTMPFHHITIHGNHS